jgi:hypothetical protein
MANSPLFDLSGHTDRVRLNVDGLLSFCRADERGRALTYAQLYRSGAIETVATDFAAVSEGRAFIRSVMWEECCIMALRHYLQTFERLAVHPPALVMLSWTGVKGYAMYVDEFRYFTGRPEDHLIDRDVLAVPEVLIENWQGDAAAILRPCFDVVWNASGYRGSLNYDKDGKWAPKR